MRAGFCAAGCAAAVLVFAAPAEAAKGTWAGTVPNTTGKVALDAKISRQGFLTKITQIRIKDVPTQCEVSGPVPAVEHTFSGRLTIQSNGTFSGTFTQETYGNQSSFSGKFKRNGKSVNGTLQVNYHYPAQGTFPEENCDTGALAFKAKFGATDETLARPAAQRMTY